ncbi:MAG: hypothetical protein Q7U47_13135 [Paludibacter sp.]|nr:hypothetical protein [Paludibacter sp.]
MILFDIKGNVISTSHKICVTNYAKDKFLSITPSCLRWTDNFNLASCFDSEQEVLEYTERPYVQEFIGDVLEQYIWTDTRKSIYENN